jgi:Fur family transcriptional regulator, ferric uptake regulator
MGCCRDSGEKIKSCGFRLTASREAIISIVENNEGHLGADDIYMMIHQKHPEIGLTTVYRTLDLLEHTGIVLKFDFGHGRAKYELAEEYSEKKHHHHLLCTKCRKIVDYSDFFDEELEYIGKAERGLKEKYGFDIRSHKINFYGICPECKAGK